MSAVSLGAETRTGGSDFDLELFERLNEEYRERPLVPAPPQVEQEARLRSARKRLRKIQRDVDFEGKRVLEIGCGYGQLTHLLVKKAGAKEAVGIDVVERDQWQEFTRRKVSYRVVDMSAEDVFDAGSVDAVVSCAVLEHVRRPVEMVEAIARVLRPGGRAWLWFNLHRGPKASHRYREVFFPWPHLLFDPEVCRAYYQRHHGKDATFSWVNRMTAASYFEAFAETGLEIEDHRRSVTEIDLEFYRRFEDPLGRYPALDLETDFLTVVLRKRRRRWWRSPPTLGYIERQRALDEALAASAG